MHGAADECLDGLQIDGPGLADSGKDHLQQPAYLLGDFALDRFGCFFSCGVKVSSNGRKRQTRSLTCTKA